MSALRNAAASLGEAITERDRQVVALKLASPLRAPAGRFVRDQQDHGHLPLFVAANEPGLL